MDSNTSPTVETPKPATEDLAAEKFMKLLPVFKEHSAKLSNAQVRRVLNALLEYPFNDKPFTFKFKQEETVYDIGRMLQDCRYVLIKAAIDMHEEQKAALANGGSNVGMA